MRLEQLEYLVGIHQYGSMNLAAQNLHVSQQAISHAIRTLEAEYGLTLLERVPRKPALTEAGQIVLEASETILNTISQMEAQLKQMKLERNTTLYSIMISPATRWCLVELAEKIYKISLDYNVKLFDGTLNTMLQKLQQHETDIIVITDLESNLKKIDFSATHLHIVQKCNLCAFVGKRSPLAQYRSLSLKSLIKYPIVLFGQIELTDCIFTQVFKQYTPQDTIHYLPNIPKDMVEEVLIKQNAVTLLPYHKRSSLFLENCTAIPLKESIAYSTCYCTRQDETLPEEIITSLQTTLT